MSLYSVAGSVLGVTREFVDVEFSVPFLIDSDVDSLDSFGRSWDFIPEGLDIRKEH